MKPKRGLKRGSNFDFEMKLQIGGPELKSYLMSQEERGSVLDIVLGLNLAPRLVLFCASICANNLALFCLGGAMLQGFLGDVGARACLEDASVIL